MRSAMFSSNLERYSLLPGRAGFAHSRGLTGRLHALSLIALPAIIHCCALTTNESKF